MEKIYTVEEIREIINQNKAVLKNDFNADKFLLFGSYSKGLQNAKSDIDLLVEFNQAVDMFKLMDLEEYLTKIFNKKIDLGTSNSLKSFVKNKILNEAIVL